MEQHFFGELERILLAEPVDDGYVELRIVAARVSSTPSSAVQVDVAWEYRDRRGDFSRPFAAEEVQILANPTYDGTALAFATWVRTELAEHISELIAAGEIGSA
jgi:hypothetical protein